ncbi:uncharacterized protein LOC130449956 [Diorhabda sublineata]|uniref:uncharacterized protein LOC130449956 n=1 Tax=Diorhabda sublineata TaxID=1163346 RepID=UPI0024E0BE78|nr:uncharacterized protein LOC130449956 [Diorhabda sublineata]
MFINKLEEPPIPHVPKMSYFSLFLKTELTCIPNILSKCLGNYYNNALCNGATWVFAFWWMLHLGFNNFLNALFKKLRFKQYERDRLIEILWYLGFYSTAVVYCGAALSQNEVELFNFKNMRVPSSTILPTQVVLGYTLILTFYLHTAFWEGITKAHIVNMFAYMFLFFFMLSSYILRVVEISFSLSALISITQMALQITRGFFVVLDQKSFYYRLFIAALFVVTFAIHVAIYLVVIPLTFIVPLGIKIMSDYPNILLYFLFFNILAWLTAEIFQSIIFKFSYHWLYHSKESQRKNSINSTEGYEQLNKTRGCSISHIECSLFLPRDDLAYEIQRVRREIEERKSKLIALQKPKNTFVQTLKYMLTINKKIKQRRRRLSEQSESYEDDEGGKLLSNNVKITEDASDSDSENDKLDIGIQKVDKIGCPNVKESDLQFDKYNDTEKGDTNDARDSTGDL